MKLLKGNVRKIMAVVMAAAIMLSITALFAAADYGNEHVAQDLYEPVVMAEPVVVDEPAPVVDSGGSYEPAPSYELENFDSFKDFDSDEIFTSAQHDEIVEFMGVVPMSGTLTVVFNPNGGVTPDGHGTRPLIPVGQTGQNTVGAANMPQPPERTDWAFRGWNRLPDGTGTNFAGNTNVAAWANAQGEIHVYAQWGHVVRFFGNPTALSQSGQPSTNQNLATNWGNRIVPDGATVNATTGMVWPNNPPARPGRTFLGWFSTYESTGGYAPGTDEGFTGDTPIQGRVDLFARWQLNDIRTVTFDPYPSTMRPGYTQVWEAYCGMTVRQASVLNQAGGIVYEGERLNVGSHRDQTVINHLPEVTARTDWTHIGWTTLGRDQHVPNFRFNSIISDGVDRAIITQDMTVYAVWAHRVTINMQNGTAFNGPAGMVTGTVRRDVAVHGGSIQDYGRFVNVNAMGGSPNPAFNAALLGMPEPTRLGFEFIGWARQDTTTPAFPNYFTNRAEAEARVNFFPDTPVYSNISTVHAVWLRNQPHTLTFNSNGGSALEWETALIPNDSNQLAIPGRTSFPADPTKPGHAFMGWYRGDATGLGSNGGNPAYRYTVAHVITEDTYVYAHWLPAFYVTFRTNGGGGLERGGVIGAYEHTVAIPQGMTWADMARNVRAHTSWPSAANGGYFQRSNYGHMPRFIEPPNHAPVVVGVDEQVAASQRNRLWNTCPNGTGDSFRWDTVVTGNMVVYRMWLVEVRFDNNHLRFTDNISPDAVRGPSRIISGSSFNTHANHADAPALAGATNPPFATVGNWATGAPAGSTLAISGRAFVGWNLDQHAMPYATTGWVDADTILTENTTVFAIFSPGVVFNSGVAPMGSIQPENRERLIETFGTTLGADMPPDPVWEGANFRGWNMNANGTGTSIRYYSNIYASIVVYAQWDLNITLNPNGGQLASGTNNPIVGFDSLIGGTLAAINNPVRANYTFAGWNTAADGSGRTPLPTDRVREGITLYAQWQPIMRTVTFDANNGTFPNAELPLPVTRTVQQGSNIGVNMPAAPTKYSYEFTGWNFVQSGLGEPFGATTNIFANFTVFAQWEPIYHTVIFDLAGGTHTGGASSQQVRHGQGATAPTAAREGHTFIGWDISFDNVTSDLLVTAQWRQNDPPPPVDNNNDDDDDPPPPPPPDDNNDDDDDDPPPPPPPEDNDDPPPPPPSVDEEDEIIVVPPVVDTPSDEPTIAEPVQQSEFPVTTTTNEIVETVEPQALPDLPEIWIEDQANNIPRVAFGGRDILLFSPLGEGSWSILSLILAVLGAVFAVMTAARVVFKKKDNRDMQSGVQDDTAEKEETKQHRNICFAAAIVMAVAGIIAFIIFNDMSMPIVLVNIWTIVNAILFAVEMVAIKLMSKGNKGQNPEQMQPAAA